MSTNRVGQYNKLEFIRWLKTASTASLSFVVRSVHEKAFKLAADIATKEVASAITRATGGQDLNTLSNNDRVVVLTLQTLKDDMQRQLDEALSAWPPKQNHGPTTP